MLGGKGFTPQAVERLGVPAFQMSDASLGVRLKVPSPAYTSSMCLAAAWDAELARRLGASIGRDARAQGVHYLLGPGLDLYRAPMRGRNFEYMRGDPVLTGQLAAAYVRGVQGQGVAATLKHYAANNQEFARHTLSSDADERTLRELELRAFQIALRDSQAKAVMSSYNPINGVHASQNGWLLNFRSRGGESERRIDPPRPGAQHGRSRGRGGRAGLRCPARGRTLPQPPRELKAFGKVFLPPGETRMVSMKTRTADLQAWDPASNQWTLFPGEYIFQAGNSSRNLPLKTPLSL